METMMKMTQTQASARGNCPVCGKNLRVTRASARVIEDEETYCSKGCFDLQNFSAKERNTRSRPFVREKTHSGYL